MPSYFHSLESNAGYHMITVMSLHESHKDRYPAVQHLQSSTINHKAESFLDLQSTGRETAGWVSKIHCSLCCLIEMSFT